MAMHALLILNEEKGNLRIIVRLRHNQMKDRVLSLLGNDKRKEAFDLLKSRAEVEVYLPPGAKLPLTPQVTLVEDLI